MDSLIEGYRRFREEVWPAERARYEALAKRGQRPETLVIACSDSRVDPSTIFGAGPGELFVVRNVAALVPPYEPDANYHGTSAALEFGVRVLQVSRIVVLGHEQCGGVHAMVAGAPEQARDFVAPWVKIAAPALRRKPGPAEAVDPMAHYEAEVVRVSLTNLMTFPWIREAVQAKRLSLHGARFAIRTGVLEVLKGDRLEPVA
ncbi:carbonic anhydrase [Craurococcus roseus]|uniref:carbonic anhydrase n=1 Tax=Craurococcus roseus TaxID=77585 RepID=A0ABP3Q9F7_9PROT